MCVSFRHLPPLSAPIHFPSSAGLLTQSPSADRFFSCSRTVTMSRLKLAAMLTPPRLGVTAVTMSFSFFFFSRRRHRSRCRRRVQTHQPWRWAARGEKSRRGARYPDEYRRRQDKWKERVGGGNADGGSTSEVRRQTWRVWDETERRKRRGGRRWRQTRWWGAASGEGVLHFWDNEKFITPSPAASLNQRRIRIADGPRRNKINLSPISRGRLKISPSLIYVCLPLIPRGGATPPLLGAMLFSPPLPRC